MTYAELKAAVTAWLYNRTDLVDQIPLFINLGERKIFRRLRCPANEAVKTWQAAAGTALDRALLPEDYLESKLLLVDGEPVKRQSDTWIYRELKNKAAPGLPQYFCRDNDYFIFWPFPDSNYPVRLTYWADLSGTLDLDDDTNTILDIAPDLYIYAALVEAMPYLDLDARGPVWEKKFETVLAEMNQQAIEAEYSGSTVEVSSVMADTSYDRF